jgi:hypothetical protein
LGDAPVESRTQDSPTTRNRTVSRTRSLPLLPAPADNVAMEAERTKAEPPKRKRRWYQFSLRTLMIFTAIIAVGFGWLVSKIAKKRHEQALVAGIREHGGGVEYDSSVPTSLRWLLGGNFFNDVQYAWITRADDATLRSLAELTRLRGLHLFGDGVTDAGLANLKRLAQLQWLYVDNTRVTDAGLVNLKGMTQLQWLRLENNNLTDTGFTNLKKALPNCRITR